MKTNYPQTQDYMHSVIRQGRSLLSDLTPEEKFFVTIRYLDEFDDTAEALLLPEGSSKLLSNFLCGADIGKKLEVQRALLNGIFNANKHQLCDIFEEALWDYRNDNVNKIVSERMDLRNQDNQERYRNIA